MIELSTSSNIVYQRPDGSFFPLEKTISLTSDAGFKLLDVNFQEWSGMLEPNSWKKNIEKVAKSLKDARMKVRQCHGCPNLFADSRFNELQQSRQLELVRRSIEASSMLGAEVVVLHPDTVHDQDGSVNKKESEKRNLEYFSEIVDFSDRFNVRIAIENMNKLPGKALRYFTYPDEILGLMDCANDSRLGVCWDFEHGVIMDFDQSMIIKELGRHLIATHVSDTSSKTDPDFMHVMPFFGNLDWNPIMSALREICYEGAFSYEAHNYANRIPDSLLPAAMLLARKIGDYLIGLYHGEQNASKTCNM